MSNGSQIGVKTLAALQQCMLKPDLGAKVVAVKVLGGRVDEGLVTLDFDAPLAETGAIPGRAAKPE